MSVLSDIGSTCALDKDTLNADAAGLDFLQPVPCAFKQPSKTRQMPYNAPLQARTMPFPPAYFCVGSACGLGPDLLEIHNLSSAGRYRTAANSNTLTKGLEKIQAAREYDLAAIFVLSSEWEEQFLIRSMAHGTVEAFNNVRCSDHSGKLDESPQDK